MDLLDASRLPLVEDCAGSELFDLGTGGFVLRLVGAVMESFAFALGAITAVSCEAESVFRPLCAR